MKIRYVLATLLLAASTAGAAAPEGLVGQTPSKLLKEAPAFAKVYRATIKEQELPEWTERISVGFPAEAVDVDGRKLVLTSACNPDTGCQDERFYLLYDPADRSLTGFFFLPPALDTPGDHRMAFSRWLGKQPTKAQTAFLMERAVLDAQDPGKDAGKLPVADPAK